MSDRPQAWARPKPGHLGVQPWWSQSLGWGGTVKLLRRAPTPTPPPPWLAKRRSAWREMRTLLLHPPTPNLQLAKGRQAGGRAGREGFPPPLPRPASHEKGALLFLLLSPPPPPRASPAFPTGFYLPPDARLAAVEGSGKTPARRTDKNCRGGKKRRSRACQSNPGLT